MTKTETLILPNKITWQDDNDLISIELTLKNGKVPSLNPLEYNATNYKEAIYSSSFTGDKSINYLMTNGDITIEDTNTIIDIIKHPHHKDFFMAIDLKYLDSSSQLHDDDIEKIIHNSDINNEIYLKLEDNNLCSKNDIINQYIKDVIDLFDIYEKYDINFEPKDNNGLKANIADIIDLYNTYDPLEQLLDNAGQQLLYYELSPKFGKYNNGLIPIDKYEDLDIAKLLSDFNLAVTKENIEILKDMLDNTIHQELTRTVDNDDAFYSLYLVVDVDPSDFYKIPYEEQKKPKVSFDNINLYIGDLEGYYGYLSQKTFEQHKDDPIKIPRKNLVLDAEGLTAWPQKEAKPTFHN